MKRLAFKKLLVDGALVVCLSILAIAAIWAVLGTILISIDDARLKRERIQSKTRPHVCLANYVQLRPGMTYFQVFGLFGGKENPNEERKFGDELTLRWSSYTKAGKCCWVEVTFLKGDKGLLVLSFEQYNLE